jgi:plastocyanin
MLRRSLVLRCLLVAVVAGLLALVAGQALAGGHIVRATSGETWNPVKTTIARGSKVTWSNPTSEVHPIVAYGGNWTFIKPLGHGASVSRVFNTAGAFLFRCKVHSYMSGGVCHGMCGKVVVQG